MSDVQVVKNPPAVRETWVGSLGCEDSLEDGMATHSSILEWRIPMDRGGWRATAHGVMESGHNWVTRHSTHGICSVTLLFNWLYLQRPYFQTESHSEAPGWHKFGGMLIQPTAVTPAKISLPTGRAGLTCTSEPSVYSWSTHILAEGDDSSHQML